MTGLTVFRNGTVLTDDEEVIHVTNWFNDEGDECDWESAVACVAGPDRNGQWLAIDLSSMDGGVLQ